MILLQDYKKKVLILTTLKIKQIKKNKYLLHINTQVWQLRVLRSQSLVYI